MSHGRSLKAPHFEATWHYLELPGSDVALRKCLDFYLLPCIFKDLMLEYLTCNKSGVKLLACASISVEGSSNTVDSSDCSTPWGTPVALTKQYTWSLSTPQKNHVSLLKLFTFLVLEWIYVTLKAALHEAQSYWGEANTCQKISPKSLLVEVMYEPTLNH